jgi:hypothetical protein
MDEHAISIPLQTAKNLIKIKSLIPSPMNLAAPEASPRRDLRPQNRRAEWLARFCLFYFAVDASWTTLDFHCESARLGAWCLRRSEAVWHRPSDWTFVLQ